MAYLGKRGYLLKIEEQDTAPEVELKHSKMILRIRSSTGQEKKQEILEAWYREQLKAALPPLIEKWESFMGVKVERCFVQKMKTKWGSCSHDSGNIRLNTAWSGNRLSVLNISSCTSWLTCWSRHITSVSLL
jgi:predicted metal-dependent hydrolase